MKQNERENYFYGEGKINKIDLEEELMFSMLPDSKGKKLLDVGCGTGEITIELEKKGFRVTGIDFSEVAIKKAKAKGIDAFVSDFDEEGISLKDNSVNVVWASDVLEHVFDPMFLLSEIKRVLQPGGIFIFTIPNDFNIYSRLLIGLKGKSVQAGIYRRFKISKHHTFFSWELIKFMLEHADFKIEKVYSFLIFPKMIKGKKQSASLLLGRLFGKQFVIKAKI